MASELVPPLQTPFVFLLLSLDPSIVLQVTHTLYCLPDKSQSPSRGQFGQSIRGKRANPRKERDDKVHDSLIEERIQRERPCRTLFIRNIKV